jgi:hypothetical protein
MSLALPVGFDLGRLGVDVGCDARAVLLASVLASVSASFLICRQLADEQLLCATLDSPT